MGKHKKRSVFQSQFNDLNQPYHESVSKKKSQKKHDQNLPIFMYKSMILEKIKTNSVVVITGPTGCGKSTQIPKYLYEHKYGSYGTIACLHPRCVAAMSLANRVSEELNQEIGKLVGYHIRFWNQKSDQTKILFMTTGLMLQIMKEENFANNYSVIVIDEAHERSVHTDIVMGKMKELLQKNTETKLIIMSATLDIDQIREYYGNCAVVNIATGQDKVNVIYRPVKDTNYLNAIGKVVEEILGSSKKGHILIFLQSEEKIFKCMKQLKKHPRTLVLPFFAALDLEEKMMVFREYGNRRKIIVSTNVAETSLTIEGVDFIIDSGFVMRVRYDHDTMVETWHNENISIAEADQRKGRTGRTGNGVCYRMYDESCVRDKVSVFTEDMEWVLRQLNNMALPNDEEKFKLKFFRKQPEPEIVTANLSTVVLTLKAMNHLDLAVFPFIVKPDMNNIAKCVAFLKDLSLLHDDERVTSLGHQVSRLPLEPRLGKVAAVGSQLACREDVNMAIAMLAVRNVLRIKSNAIGIFQQFAEGLGDLVLWRNLFCEARDNRFQYQWCKENMVNYSLIKYADRVAKQLNQLLRRPYCGGNYFRPNFDHNLFKKTFLAGFFHNIAIKLPDGSYQTLTGIKVRPYKCSSIKDSEKIVLYLNIQRPSAGSDIIIKNCSGLNDQMIKNLVPQKFRIKAPVWKAILDKI